MMNSLASILNNKGSQSPLIRGVTAAMIIEEANRQLAIMFGDEIASQANAVYMRLTTLCIACLSTTAAGEIKMRETELLNAILAKIPNAEIKKVRYLS